MDKDYGDSLNFIDERKYNEKIIEMINDNSPNLGQKLVGEWYFTNPNQLEVNYPSANKKFSLTFDEAQNLVTIESPSGEAGFP